MERDIIIRPEEPADIEAIHNVTEHAFAGHAYSDGTEAAIVDGLRSRHGLAISLVAERSGQIVGHVAFSPASAADGSAGWYALGPISVHPDLQRQGIGSRLVRDGLRMLQDLKAVGCIVVGDENYYARFGFRTAPDHAPGGVPREHFMVLNFRSETLPAILSFHAAFGV